MITQPNSGLQRFNTKLGTAVGVIAALVIFRLFLSANSTSNWEGFWFSTLHVAIVAAGSFILLRERA